jgi:hypothetical protein
MGMIPPCGCAKASSSPSDPGRDKVLVLLLNGSEQLCPENQHRTSSEYKSRGLPLRMLIAKGRVTTIGAKEWKALQIARAICVPSRLQQAFCNEVHSIVDAIWIDSFF